jgi:hypothetical protein
MKLKCKENVKTPTIPEEIHYQDFFAAVDRAEEMSEEILSTIREKPPTTDYQADTAWRRLCATWFIGTGSREGFRDRARDAREKRMALKIEALEAEVAALKDQNKARVQLRGVPNEVLEEYRLFFFGWFQAIAGPERDLIKEMLKLAPDGRFKNIMQNMLMGLSRR